ncbi:hypothetical protein POZ13_04675, partial [Bacteroides uniformis]|nr:hypothetical protein [Bacteroides uniformis]MDC1833410.1 hypothetical protein [Bacteroides uniformis]
MKAIEFYTTPEGEVTMRPIGEAERQLKETDTDFIQAFLAILREFYPEAYDALMDIYSKNSNNKRYRDFIAVRRFIKCNFGLYDNMIDVDENWNFNFEFVGCPLRGECWKIQCKLPPKTKRFCPLKTFNNAPLKSLDRWGYYYFSLFPSVCSHFTDTFSCQLNPVRR